MHGLRLIRTAGLTAALALVLTGLTAAPASAFPGELKGWVSMAPNGGLLRDAHAGEVIVHYAPEGETTLNPHTATTSADGRFLLTGITEKRVRLFFEYVGTEAYHSQWWGISSVDTVPRESVEVYDHVIYSMVMRQPSTLSGSATLEGGSVPPGGQLTVSYRTHVDGQWTDFGPPQVVGPDGRYEFPGLLDGSYGLRLDYSGPGDWFSRYYWDSPDLARASSLQFMTNSTVDLVMPSLETVSGHVYTGTPVFPETWQAVGAGQVTVSVSHQYLGEAAVQLPQFTTTADASGAFSIRGLPPRGCYTLTFTNTGPGYFQPISHISCVSLGFDTTVRDHVIPPMELESVTAPVVTGTYQVGRTLTASTGTYNFPPTAYSYRWRRDGSDVDNVYDSRYVLTSADLGHTLTVTVYAGYPGRWTLATESEATPVIAPANLTKAPTPAIAGTARVGSTLIARPGAWPAGTTFSYQWSANGAPLPGQTDTDLLVPPAAVGKRITVTVTGTAPGYAPYAKTSASSAAVVATSFSTAPVPRIVGVPQVGVPLTADPGAWSPAASFRYQWYANGIAIRSATTSTFTPTGSQLGKRITVRVVASAQGYVSAGRTSARSAIVKVGEWSASPAPEVSGTAQVGLALSAVTAGWQPGARFAYQWYADGSAISNATASTFVPRSSELGKAITVRIRTTTSGYPVVRLASAPTAAVAAGVFTVTPTPAITGTVRVGSTLTALRSIWAPAPTYRYQWLADGIEIPKATASTLTLSSSLAGKQISVAVTGTRPGFTTVVRESLPTAPVSS